MGNVSVERLVEALMSCSDTDLDGRVRALVCPERRSQQLGRCDFAEADATIRRRRRR